MQTTSERSVPGKVTRRRKRLSSTTIAIGALVAILSIGVTLFVFLGGLFGFWPPRDAHTVSVTPTSEFARGLLTDVVGAPRRDGDQWVVTVKVTNQVQVNPQVTGTQEPNAPTPEPKPARVLNGGVKVLFYDKPASDRSKQIVGGAFGNVTDLPYGESREIEVVAVGVGDFAEGGYEAFPDTVWTDLDPVKTKEETPSDPTPAP